MAFTHPSSVWGKQDSESLTATHSAKLEIWLPNSITQSLSIEALGRTDSESRPLWVFKKILNKLFNSFLHQIKNWMKTKEISKHNPAQNFIH